MWIYWGTAMADGICHRLLGDAVEVHRAASGGRFASPALDDVNGHAGQGEVDVPAP